MASLGRRTVDLEGRRQYSLRAQKTAPTETIQSGLLSRTEWLPFCPANALYIGNRDYATQPMRQSWQSNGL